MAARSPLPGKPARSRRAKSGPEAHAEAPSGPPNVDSEPVVVEASAEDGAPEPELLEAEVLDAHFVEDVEVVPALDEEAEVDADVDVDVDELGDLEIDGGDSGPSLPLLPATDHAALLPSDALTRYLAEIRAYPILSREEEHATALRYFHDGDADAAVKLITSNLRLVVVVAREYQRAFHNLLDLIQEGNVGLLEAVKQFDPYRGVRFPSYAVWWVRAYVIRYVMNNFRLVKVGTTQAQRRLFFNLKKEKARLEALGFQPSARQIAESLGVKEKEVIEMDQRLATASEVSVETPLGHDSGAGTMLDLLPAPGGDAEDEVSAGEFYALMKGKLGEFGATLKGREAEIFRERLVAEDPLTLQELGDRYGVSRERVRQMEAGVKKKLREYLVSQVRDLDRDMVR